MSTKAEEVVDVILDAKRVEPEKETFTNWGAIAKSRLVPTFMKCDGYLPMHPHNNGCHTTLPHKPHIFAAHLDGGHGGGIFISFRDNYKNDMIGVNLGSTIKQSEKEWLGWDEFRKEGLEIKDFRCDVCNAEIKLNPNAILKHCKPHQGKTSRLRPGGDFWITLSRDFAQGMEEEDAF